MFWFVLASEIFGNFDYAAVFSDDFDSDLKSSINNQLIFLSTNHYNETLAIYRKYIEDKDKCNVSEIRPFSNKKR